jgi:hypothetical protein
VRRALGASASCRYLPCTHTRAHTHTLTHTRARARTHTRAHTHSHTRAHTHSHTRARARTHTHARARARIHTHARARTHVGCIGPLQAMPCTHMGPVQARPCVAAAASLRMHPCHICTGTGLTPATGSFARVVAGGRGPGLLCAPCSAHASQLAVATFVHGIAGRAANERGPHAC